MSFLSLSLSLSHCKKGLSIFPSPAGMPLTKLSLDESNLIPGQGEFGKYVTSRLGTGKPLTFFYSVYSCARTRCGWPAHPTPLAPDIKLGQTDRQTDRQTVAAFIPPISAHVWDGWGGEGVLCSRETF
jgi:hypothetical protein